MALRTCRTLKRVGTIAGGMLVGVPGTLAAMTRARRVRHNEFRRACGSAGVQWVRTGPRTREENRPPLIHVTGSQTRFVRRRHCEEKRTDHNLRWHALGEKF